MIRLILDNFIKKLKFFVLNKKENEILSKIYKKNILKEISKKGLNNYILDGFRVYSQNDEDGIIESIFSDIEVSNKTFIEIGIGNGIENNSHYLLLKNWKGFWIDSNKKNINKIKKILPKNNILKLSSKNITPENIDQTIIKYLKDTNNQNKEIDFFSIDIDSVDINCLQNVKSIKPRLICIEYNSKFPSNFIIQKEYLQSKNNTWNYNDYFGASLLNIVNKMKHNKYELVSTNITGSNAFFVRGDLYKKCKTYKKSVEDLYMPTNYNLYNYNNGHMPSLNFLIQHLDKK